MGRDQSGFCRRGRRWSPNLETALFGGFLDSGALVDVLVGLEQAFLDDVVVRV